MIILAGLGNPGAEYEDTRHNIGFMAVDAVYGKGGFSPWKEKFKALIAEGMIDGKKVLLVKPQTFVNNSGEAIQPLMQFYKFPLGDLTVFHDDMDLAPGKVRIKTGGSSGGHNGLKSIEAHCGKDYRRVRLGIGHPEHDHETVVNFVLGKFFASDHDWIDPLIKAAGDEISLLVNNDINGFLNKIHTYTHKTESNKSAGKAPAAKAYSDSAPGEKSGDTAKAKWNSPLPGKASAQPRNAMADKLESLLKEKQEK